MAVSISSASAAPFARIQRFVISYRHRPHTSSLRIVWRSQHFLPRCCNRNGCRSPAVGLRFRAGQHHRFAPALWSLVPPDSRAGCSIAAAVSPVVSSQQHLVQLGDNDHACNALAARSADTVASASSGCGFARPAVDPARAFQPSSQLLAPAQPMADSGGPCQKAISNTERSPQS